MNGMLPTTTTAASAPVAARTALSTPLVIVSLANRAAPAAVVAVSASEPSAATVRYFSGPDQSNAFS
jgi:hypothetical protein